MFALPHGGGCCGINHVNGWGTSPWQKTTKEQLQHLVRRANGRARRSGVLCEVVLTDQQIKANPEFLEWLQELDFKLVQRFKNKNSYNFCNVFHYHPNPQPLDDLPFDWKNNE